jgi:energy-converting hydrogenase Eha subunit A
VNKQNLIIQAAVAGLFSAAALSAYATGTGSAVGNSAQIANQAVTNTTDIGTGSIQYVQTGSIPVGNYYVYVQLNQGATFAAGAASAVNSAALQVFDGSVSDTNVTVGSGVVSTDSTFVAFPITVAASLPANVETFTFKPVSTAKADGSVTNASGAVTAGSLTATISIGSSASFSTTTIVQDESTASTAPIAYFVSGISSGALSSGLFTAGGPTPFHGVGAEKAVINVIGSSGITLTDNINVAGSQTVLDLGAYYFEDVNVTHSTGATTPPFGADAATGFNIATDYAASHSTAVVTAPAGFFNVATETGGSVYLSASANCAGGIVSGVVSNSGATASFTVPTGYPSSFIIYVCVAASSTAVDQTAVWVSGTPTLTATLVANATTTANVTLASTPLYTLGTNGASVYVREYVPAAATATSGYQSFLRVINTGTVPAKISFTFIDDTSGAASTSATGTTTSAVPVGGAITLTSAQIEALVGTPEAASARPRVLVTAPTSLTVQSYLYNAAANVFTEVSGGSNGGAGTGYYLPSQTGQ